MEHPEIERAILRATYKAWFPEHETADLNTIRDEGYWNETTFNKVVHRLEERDLIRSHTIGCNYMITPQGVLHAEEKDIAPKELKSKNDTIRTQVMDALARAYEESDPNQYKYIGVHIKQLPSKRDTISPGCS